MAMNKHAEKKHWMALLVQTSVQAGWWGGRMGEALGKTPVSKLQQQSMNSQPPLWLQTVREQTSDTRLILGRGRACLSCGERAPSRLRNLPSPWPRSGYIIQGERSWVLFFWGVLNFLWLSHEQSAFRTQGRLWAPGGHSVWEVAFQRGHSEKPLSQTARAWLRCRSSHTVKGRAASLCYFPAHSCCKILYFQLKLF